MTERGARWKPGTWGVGGLVVMAAAATLLAGALGLLFFVVVATLASLSVRVYRRRHDDGETVA
jgi:hypothetical protein